MACGGIGLRSGKPGRMGLPSPMNVPALRGGAVLALLALAPCVRAVPLAINVDASSTAGDFHGTIDLDLVGTNTSFTPGANYFQDGIGQSGVAFGLVLIGEHTGEVYAFGSIGLYTPNADSEPMYLHLRGGGNGGTFTPGVPEVASSGNSGVIRNQLPGQPQMIINVEWFLPQIWDGERMTGTGTWSVQWSPVPDTGRSLFLLGSAIAGLLSIHRRKNRSLPTL